MSRLLQTTNYTGRIFFSKSLQTLEGKGKVFITTKCNKGFEFINLHLGITTDKLSFLKEKGNSIQRNLLGLFGLVTLEDMSNALSKKELAKVFTYLEGKYQIDSSILEGMVDNKFPKPNSGIKKL